MLDLCKASGLRLCNDRCWDKSGRVTFFNHLGSSVIDYVLVHKDYYDFVSFFKVLDFNMWSDHAPIEFNLRSLCNSTRSTVLDNSVSSSTYTIYKWNDDKSKDMRSSLEQRLSDLYQSIESFENSNVGIDSCVDRLTQIVNGEFDSHCCKRVNNSSNKPSKVKNKIWFDEKCGYLHTIEMSYEHMIKIRIRTIGNL